MSGESDRHQAVNLLGPWLIGGCLDLFLQGVLCTQMLNYFTWYKEDKLVIRLYVTGLAIASVLKSAQSFAVIWIQSILFINNLPGAILLNYTSPWFAGNPMMVATFDLYCQSYFLYRLHVISRRLPIVLPLATLFIFAYASMILATYYITLGAAVSSSIALWFACHLSSVFAADVLLSCSTAFFLIRSKQNVLPQTVGLISALVRLTFQTAAPAAICAMFNLVFSQVYVGTENLTSTAFNMALPKLYAVSMMWTLNARRTIRASHSSRQGISSSNEVSAGRGNSRRGGTHRNDVELGNFSSQLSGIQVHTVQETSIDVRDMFAPAEDHKTRRGRRDKDKDRSAAAQIESYSSDFKG